MSSTILHMKHLAYNEHYRAERRLTTASEKQPKDVETHEEDVNVNMCSGQLKVHI